EEVTQAQHKCESRSRQNSRNGKRKDDSPESLKRRRSQIVRRLYQVAGYVFERRINRQEGERCVDMREGQHHGERAVQQEIEGMTCQVNILQQRVKDAVAAQDGLPGVSSHQIADPERNNHQLIEE